MSTNYPGALDSFVNPTATDTLDSATVPHAAQHDNINDAMSAVQVTLGVNPQGGSATVVARLTALDSTVAGKAATNQTMYVGTTALAINRSSASQTLTGVSIDGNAATATSATTAGSVTNGVYTNVSNTFTTGTQIIATGADGTVGFRIKRNSATQTANLLEVTQSDGTTILAKIDSAGAITTASGLTASGNISTSGSITVTGGGNSIQTTGLASYISANAYMQTPQFVAGASASATPGTILINGAASGTATLNVPSTAGGTHTFPATGGTVVNSGTTTLPSGITSIPNVTTANGLTSASSLATVGTIGSGTWQGSIIQPAYGGTGNALGATAAPLWYSSSSDIGLNAGGSITGATDYSLFNLSAGVTLAASTTYFFEMLINLLPTYNTATSRTFNLTMSNTCSASMYLLTYFSSSSAGLGTTNFGASIPLTSSTTTICSAAFSTNSALTHTITARGIVRTSTSGSFNPSFRTSAAGATMSGCVTKANSYISFTQLAASSTTSNGTWS